MDEQSLYTLDQDTLLLVPTGSLATHLNEVAAAQHVQHGAQVWEAPNIMSWSELLRDVWQRNRQHFNGVNAVLGAQQAKLLWTQVVEQSRYANQELTLLNVPQTVKAVMRSDKLLADWGCDVNALKNDHVHDINQFLSWREAYHELLVQRGLLDESRLQIRLLELAQAQQINWPTRRVMWYAYDLVTATQRAFNVALQAINIIVEFAGPNVVHDDSSKHPATSYRVFDDEDQELTTVFQQARAELEKNLDTRIHIVVPDLQHRYSQVQEVARRVFYPNASLTDVQHNHSVYRFSLGKALHEWPAVEVALCTLGLLRSSISIMDFGFICRSVYLGAVQNHNTELLLFERWLRRRRIRRISLERIRVLLEQFYQAIAIRATEQEKAILAAPALPEFFEELQNFYAEIQTRLSAQKLQSGYRALSFSAWAEIIDAWLMLWGWQANRKGTEYSSLALQLRRRWISALQEFAGLGAVQRSAGLSRAFNSFEQIIRDSVFLPKAAMAPLVVSGLLEALGRETDQCYVVGMTQDFPAANKNDAFIPSQHLQPTGFPDASPQTSIAQAEKVMHSLLGAARWVQLSFALESSANADIANQASPLFMSEFAEAQLAKASALQGSQPAASQVPLEAYMDIHGPAWNAPEKARGGATIFKNQSLCPFKAFATHQLRFELDDEPEFGLDHLDRGTLTHKMLELVWAQLPDQNALADMDAAQQSAFLQQTFKQLLAASEDLLPDDKLRLLALEQDRVIELTDQWLNLERLRPTNFSVVERESEYQGQWGGIRFNYVIDRVDLTDSGESVIVDYKTGYVSRNDWLGPRPSEPQLPLYALARDQLKQTPVSGIAFGQVRRDDSKFFELAAPEIFPASAAKANEYAELWSDNRQQWPMVFDRLAEDFLSGYAAVDPVDASACQYCDLQAVCRVEELSGKARSVAVTEEA